VVSGSTCAIADTRVIVGPAGDGPAAAGHGPTATAAIAWADP